MAAPAQARFRVPLVTKAASGPWLMGASLACADLLSLLLAVPGGFLVWKLVNYSIPPMQPAMWLGAVFSVAAFAFFGLYPGIGLTAVELVRRMYHGITLVYLLLTAVMFLQKGWSAASRGGFFVSWALAMVMVPMGRWLCGRALGSQSWWGVPVMILGAGTTARTVIRNLRENEVLGYRPVVCLDDDFRKHGTCHGVPVEGCLTDATYFAARYKTTYAIVAMPQMPREQLVRHLQQWSKVFAHILIVPDLFGVASLWTEPRDLGGVLGLEIRHNLLIPVNRWIKRGMDATFAAVGLLAAAPLLAMAALWIKRASPGSALYSQEREGRDGKPIRILKLRTMYPDAEGTLEMLLEKHPGAREEWNRFCKLRKDPRILPGVGHFLRKTSLDELPQLWNILKGEMSLVGPRPFPRYHNERFHPEFSALRTQVTPGLTGLWQISARSDGDIEVQASLDGYYIRNWSLWLDVYILIRTVRTVLAREGAY
jgi:Undecaprenyl-phosphate galactose phosphotransferase WbaP